MKKTALIASIVFAFFMQSRDARAEKEIKSPFFVDYEAEVPGGVDGKLAACFAYFNRLGVFSCVKMKDDYAQAYIGPTWEYKEWLRFGGGWGFEAKNKGELSQRYAGFVNMRKNPAEFALEAETGGSGLWYRGVLGVAAWKSSYFGLSPGVMVQSKDGIGPRVEIHLLEAYTKIWIAPLYDWEEKRTHAIVGVRAILY